MRFRGRPKNHITRDGMRELGGGFPGRQPTKYEVWTCDHCGHEMLLELGRHPDRVYEKARRHLEVEHPEELERDEYPNEAAFREWADRIEATVHEPREPGKPIVVTFGTGKEVELHSDGSIILKAYRHLGGAEDAEAVNVQGNRLVVDGPARSGYVSDRAFPVLRW